MKTRIWASLGICMLAGLMVGCSTGPNMKEGKWEITTETGMKGLSLKMPAISTNQCLTRKELIPQLANDSSCVVSDKKVDGDAVSWTAVCTDGGSETKSRGMITYSGVLFSGQIDVIIDSGPLSMNVSKTVTGKYLGPCD